MTKYTEGIGRRKTASARVRIVVNNSDKTNILINQKPLTEYFKLESHQQSITDVLAVPDAGIDNYDITVHVSGSGLSAQAEAIRLGIARALVKEKIDRRQVLKPKGFLERDQRSVERKKFGLRKARRRPQWSKR